MNGAAAAAVEWGWAGAPLEGEFESGDEHVVAEIDGGVVLAVIDGLGHGSEAAVAARAASRCVAALAHEPVEVIVQECHRALRHTRGVVMTVAKLDSRACSLTWLAVGNVEAILVRRDPAKGARENVTPRGGVVGYHLPPLRPSTVLLNPGDTLVMATDGIRAAFVDALRATDPPELIARTIHAQHARGSDDALVLAARFLGAPP